MGSYSNQTDRCHWLIKRVSVVFCLVFMLEACNLLQRFATPPPTPEPAPEPVKDVVIPCPSQPASWFVRQSLPQLDKGQTDAARRNLQCALDLSPNSSMATRLLEQLEADPVDYLGEKHFWYTVKSNDTLGNLARRYLGSSMKFVILARYNDIAVPASLDPGQKIKIPGSRPVRASTPVQRSTPVKAAAPAPERKSSAKAGAAATALRDQALAMEQQGKLEKAYELITRAIIENPSVENVQADHTRIKNKLISEREEDAYNLELNGEMKKAADTWRKVLEINADYIPAQLALKRLAR